MSADRLAIVYNAEAGLIAGVKDSLHKLLKPETYPCSLCALTHGAVRTDPRWKRFLARITLGVVVYHRADFRTRYPGLQIELPAVLIERGRDAKLIISAEELRGLATVEALIARVEDRLAQLEPTGNKALV